MLPFGGLGVRIENGTICWLLNFLENLNQFNWIFVALEKIIAQFIWKSRKLLSDRKIILSKISHYSRFYGIYIFEWFLEANKNDVLKIIIVLLEWTHMANFTKGYC